MTKEQAIEVLHELEGSLYETQQVALDMAIKALEIVEEFEKAQIITGGRLNGRTFAYKCGLEDGKRKSLEQQPSEDCVSLKEVEKWLHQHVTISIPSVETQMFEQLEKELPRVTPTQSWIPVSERLPETDNENSINNYNVLLWVKNKSHPEREPQIYSGKLRHIDGDDGSGNFWRIETKPCDWTIWGWSYFNEPDVIAWQPLPKPYEEKRGGKNEDN